MASKEAHGQACMFILWQTSVKMAVLLHKLGYQRFHSIIAVCMMTNWKQYNMTFLYTKFLEAVWPQKKLIVCKSALHLELLGLSKDELRVSEDL